MAGKFSSLANLRTTESSRPLKDKGRDPASIEQGTEGPRAAKSPVRAGGPGRPAGKRSNPDYEQTTVLLKKKTKRAAVRMLEDAGKKPDLSDLLQALLDQHVAAQT